MHILGIGYKVDIFVDCEEKKMEKFYSAEKNVQYLLALMKAHGIRNIVVSPGTTNFTFVGSAQIDSFFNIISCVDERSAAYMACGIAAITKEPVAISCTGATASRNYMPGLTEAYYRKLPVLAITATRNIAQLGHNIDQMIDRRVIPNDIAKKSIYLPIPSNSEEDWACQVKINDALLELKRAGGGPVHINMTTEYNTDFSVKELPNVNVIKRYSYDDKLPLLSANSVAIFVGAHLEWDQDLTATVEMFCEKYNGVVLCDQCSNYKGKYSIFANIIHQQKYFQHPIADLIISIGDVSASAGFKTNISWRVNPDGEIRDTFRNLNCVFEMKEQTFFAKYCELKKDKTEMSFYQKYRALYEELIEALERTDLDMPFSNVWMAKRAYKLLPPKSTLYLGILNSLRAWNYFEVDKSILGYANTGGYGIDGGVSSMIGASIIQPEQLSICVTGDLAFFYDMNCLGNRHIGANVRILIVNNGIGEEFKHNMTPITRAGFQEDANEFMAAEGHFGNKSRVLVKHYAEDLGFEYISASTKEEFSYELKRFLDITNISKPIVFEVFTDYQDETDAIEILQGLKRTMGETSKQIVKDILGEKGVSVIKRMMKN